VFEATVFPDTYRRFAASVRGPGPYVVTGKVEDHLGAISITADRIERAPETAGSPLSAEPSSRQN
jgi:predicted kinase